jgi:YgiT-type zinc finger domain-containing protein
MTCFFCKGRLENKLTTFTTEIDGNVVIIRNVPALVCTQCGEVSYSTDVMQQIEAVTKEMRAQESRLPPQEISVLNYARGRERLAA